jgi:hypothetical protein
MNHNQTIFNLLQQAGRAIDAKDYPALAEIAAPIMASVPDNLVLAGPLLVVAQRLGEQNDYLGLAIKAAEIVHDHVPPGSELQRQAVDTLAKLADGLHEAMRIPTLQESAQRFVQKYKL